MSEANSTMAAVSGKATNTNKPTKSTKPAKPYPQFPLSAHAVGYWAKKIRGRVYFFGPWNDPEASPLL